MLKHDVAVGTDALCQALTFNGKQPILEKDMATRTYNVSVTEAQGWFVEQQVRLGRYNNVSEVVRDGLRRLETEAAQRDSDEFNRLFAGGNRGPETEADVQRINRALKKARAG